MRSPLVLPLLACILSCSAARPTPAPLPSPPVSVAAPPGLSKGADPAELPAPPVPVPCGHDGWTTYAHDAARTSASGACLHAPLHVSWTFAPPQHAGRAASAAHVVVDGDAAYVQGVLGSSPALWRLDARSGELAWTFDSRADIPHLSWPTLAPRTVLMVDDGLFFVDPELGKNRGRELDAWGESLTDGEHLFVMNTWQADGYGPYLGAFDLEGRPLWKRDSLRRARGFAPPDVGGVAMADAVLVHASNQAQRGAHLAAFDAPSSQKLWSLETTPESAPSLGDGRIFMVERWRAEKVDRVVARALVTGEVLWSHELRGARGAAPVVAGKLLVVHGEGGVIAYDDATGATVWTSPVPRTVAVSQALTTLAAAMGSGTLVVCSGATVHVLRLADGVETWTATPVPGASRLDSPVIAGDALYLAADGVVARLDP